MQAGEGGNGERKRDGKGRWAKGGERERERVDATTRKDRHRKGGGAGESGRVREGPENEFRF